VSFILDALADSEQARQRIAVAPAYSLLPALNEDMRRPQIWPHAIALAALANAAVLLFWMRPVSLGDVTQGKAIAGTAPAHVRTPVSNPGIQASARIEAPLVDTAPPATHSPRPKHQRIEAQSKTRPTTPRRAIPRKEGEEQASANTPEPKQDARPNVRDPRAVDATALAASTPTPVAQGAAPEVSDSPRPQMPTLSIAGFIREEGSASMVIVNDRLAREGDVVAPGLTLEKIVGDSLIFNYMGQRFKR
jgi:hypothetical protein